MSSLTLRLRQRSLTLQAGRPLLMGIVNCTPDSFSDSRRLETVDERVQHGLELAEAGAAIIDVGGESGVTHRPQVGVREELERVVPVVERLVDHGLIVSVDTWKPEVAEAVLSAGAHLINDVSGLYHARLASVVAARDAGIVLMHTRAAPKTEHFPDYGGRVVADVRNVLGQLRERALQAGVRSDAIVLDPGPDFAKMPAESVEVLRDLRSLAVHGHPLLLAVSRKYFVGTIIHREPDDRLAGTLAALGWCAERAKFSIARVHDVREAADYLKVRAVLDGVEEMPSIDRDDVRLQWLHDDEDDDEGDPGGSREPLRR
ncbi:Dihydropteroate synthase [Patulibacter medicamentivorans]|uniref:dihydropteroate synthase n=1 Tax=Patulibacter medicamentivorans TaxID=1097667 RepID=H0E0F6_9ACTN|nr:dihydropteroate synthase [Patulibacter medicamentivorans]EHN12840.1 Dihydropteroate synthase [Patulibacter medicamentivorans]